MSLSLTRGSHKPSIAQAAPCKRDSLWAPQECTRPRFASVADEDVLSGRGKVQGRRTETHPESGKISREPRSRGEGSREQFENSNAQTPGKTDYDEAPEHRAKQLD